MDKERISREFPGTQDKAFLDAACVSITPRSAFEAVTRFMDMALACSSPSSTLHHIKMDEMRRQATVEAARLLNTSQDNIALVENTTLGLNIVANGVKLPPGSKVLVNEMEFLQVAIPWVMQYERGIEVVSVPQRGGRVLPECFEPYITPDVRMLVLSGTQWNNGFRSDLAAFSDLCHRHDMLLVVDAVQQLGAIKTYPEQDGVDFMTGGGHKWLNAPFGCGILYVSPQALPLVTPSVWGYMNLENPEGGWGNYFSDPRIVAVRPPQAYSFLGTAQRLETGGTSNYPGAVGLAASMRLVNDIGIDSIEEHVLGLTDRLIAELPSTGATVITVPERKHRSGIVTFRFYRDLEAERQLVARLCSEGVLVGIRFTAGVGGVRVSCHYFNTNEHLDSLLLALRRAAKDRAPDYITG